MTTRTDPTLEPLDLSIRARRGALSAAEQRAFEQTLAESATLRVAHQIGRSFDVLARVRPGDEAFVERIADRALANRTRGPRRRFSTRALLLAAAFVVASAVAATRVVTNQVPTAPSGARATHATGNAPSKPAPVSVAPSWGEASETSAPTPARSPTAAPERARSAQAGPPAPSAVTEDDAASLFRRAGSARRAGALESARALYVELQTRFPDSNEARVSRVSLGKLLLGAGKAREAELEFARYLRSGASDLREEALVGRADALALLGRGSEERNVWQELLRRHPGSVYGIRARERLAELESSRPSE